MKAHGDALNGDAHIIGQHCILGCGDARTADSAPEGPHASACILEEIMLLINTSFGSH